MHRYLYANSNPFIYYDPTGREPDENDQDQHETPNENEPESQDQTFGIQIVHDQIAGSGQKVAAELAVGAEIVGDGSGATAPLYIFAAADGDSEALEALGWVLVTHGAVKLVNVFGRLGISGIKYLYNNRRLIKGLDIDDVAEVLANKAIVTELSDQSLETGKKIVSHRPRPTQTRKEIEEIRKREAARRAEAERRAAAKADLNSNAYREKTEPIEDLSHGPGPSTGSQDIPDDILKGNRANTTPDTGPNEPYNRKKHYGSTPTQADRKAVGAGVDEVADHDPPLVKRYYEGDPVKGEKPGYQMTDEERRRSARDRSRMNPQPRSESNKQGGKMSKYSREKKKEHGL